MDMTPFRERRSRLAAQLRAAGGGIALLSTAPERQRNADNDHPYRHDSHFHYLTGFDEPGAWLLIRSDGRSTLLCREKDPEREIWDGLRVGSGAAPQRFEVDEAFAVDTLDAVVVERLADQPAVWIPAGVEGLPARLDGWLDALRARERSGVRAPSVRHDLSPLLAEMRLVKDAGELATMRRAAAISAGAHRRAMRFCAQHFRADPRGSVREYEIEAELLHEFRRHGAKARRTARSSRPARTPACCTTRPPTPSCAPATSA